MSRDSLVKLNAVGSSLAGNHSSRLVIRSADGDVVAVDNTYSFALEFGYHHEAELIQMLSRGVYVIEVAAEFEHTSTHGHWLRYKGLGIIWPQEFQPADADLTEIVSASNIYTAVVAYDTDTVTVTAVANHGGARAVVSPPDADPDTLAHEIAVAAPATGEGSARTVAAVAVTAQDGTRSTYAVVIVRPAGAPTTQITMELPEGCVLHELGAGNVTPTRRWHDGCDSLHVTDKRGAQYYRLFVRTESLIWLKVDGDSSSRLVVRDADGGVVAIDRKNSPRYYDAELLTILPRGVYVVEVAAEYHHFGHRGHELNYKGEGIIAPYAYRLDDLAISHVGLASFDPGAKIYARNVAADVSTVTVTPTPVFAYSTVEISPADSDAATEGHQVVLESDGSTDITVTVSSPEFPELTTTYTVTLNRLTGTTSPLSDDATLSGLSLSGVDIGTFSSDDYRYGTTLWVADERPNVKAYNLKTGARRPGLDLRTGNSRGMWSNGATAWVLGYKDNIFGYSLPENARLKQLSLDVGDIGVFNNGIFDYAAVVPSGTTTATITAEAAFTGGSSAVAFSVNDADTATSGHQATLTADVTTVTITVTAPNGTDTDTYTVRITRAQ